MHFFVSVRNCFCRYELNGSNFWLVCLHPALTAICNVFNHCRGEPFHQLLVDTQDINMSTKMI